MSISIKAALAVTCFALTANAQEPAQQPAASPVIASKLQQSADAIPGQYIVVLKDTEVGAAHVPELAQTLAARHRGNLTVTYSHALRGFAVKMSEADARALAAAPEVAYVVEDGKVHTTGWQQNPTWGLDRIDQQTRYLDGLYNHFATGDGVHAYILDTGILTTHPDFGGRATGDFTVFNDGRGASDCHGHGTHVAGTVGSATWGVAKNVRLHSVRVLGCTGWGTWSGVISGIDWVTANHLKPAVANMSLGGGPNQAADDAVRRSIAAGVTYVIAAGNSDQDACDSSPSRVAEALIVGATDSQDSRASWSNYGTCLDLFAPGVDITSTSINGGSTLMSGTSMASPHVAGAVALFLDNNRGASPGTVSSALISGSWGNVVINPGSGSPNRMLYTSPLGPQAAPKVALRSSLGYYMVAEEGGEDVVNANRNWIGPWERFILIDLNGGTLANGDPIALQSYHGYYVTADGGGGSGVSATSTAIGPRERFTLVDLNDGSVATGDEIALRSHSGYYVVAENGGGGVVNANRTAIGSWEKFTLLFQ